MSLRCQCPFSGASDTILGCHRDPITCEKGWLDFAVRELSRVAAGKGRGQEAVWRSQCKPDWWDCVCPHPWKNPTANPKDSKDTLKVKFECLVQHLRKVGQLPQEMEQEIDLWERGRKSEVFMMTSLSSLLGQASNLHFLLDDTCHKMEESGIQVDKSILADLQNCLTACVNKLGSIESMTDKRNQKGNNSGSAEKHAGKKRPSTETVSVPQPPSKQPKQSFLASPPPSSTTSGPGLVNSPPASALSSSPCPSLSPPPVVTNVSISTDLQMRLLAALQEKILQKPVLNIASAASPVCQAPQTHRLPKSKAHVHPHRAKGGKKKEVLRAEEGCVATAVNTTSDSIPLPACQLAAVPHNSFLDLANNTEFTDLLDFDLEGDDILHFPFSNKSSVKESSDTSVNNTTTAACPLVPQPVPHQSADFPEPGVIQNSPANHCSHDPFIGHSPSSSLSESSPFQFDVEPETVAGRLVESVWSDGECSTASASGVRDMIRSPQAQDTEISDAGYHSEASVTTSHRGSLDSEHNSFSDLNSPDLEAFLDAL